MAYLVGTGASELCRLDWDLLIGGKVRLVRVEHHKVGARDEARRVGEMIDGVEAQTKLPGLRRVAHLSPIPDALDGVVILCVELGIVKLELLERKIEHRTSAVERMDAKVASSIAGHAPALDPACGPVLARAAIYCRMFASR